MTHNYGVAILMFALAAKVVLLYFAYKGKRGMLQQQRMQPKVQELQKKYGKDKQRMQQEQQKLYQSEGVSMFGGCLWMFIPFPIIIALYGAVRRPLTYIMQLSQDTINELQALLGMEGSQGFAVELEIAEKLNDPVILNKVQSVLGSGFEPVNFTFFGANLAQIPNFSSMIWLIPVISAATSFLSAWLMQKFSGRPPAAGMSNLMIYAFGPGISLWIGFTWPAALAVYWIGQNILQIPQEYFLIKYWNRKLDEEEAAKAARDERRKAAEAAQKEEDRQRRSERIAEKNKKHKPKRYKLQNKPPASEEEREEE
jgi:YidC/Oxa1 family membrane protein insertase